MKHLCIVFVCGMSLLFMVSTGWSAPEKPAHPSRLTYPSLQWDIPDGTRYRDTLSNGLIAYIAADTALPLVHMSVFIRYGSLHDPADKSGLSYLTARLMRTGGTEAYPADSLDRRIDFIAMNTSFSAGETLLRFDFSFLSRFSDTALAIIDQLLFHPVFDTKKIAEEKRIYATTLQNRFQNPEPTLSAAYKKALYPGSPVSAFATQRSIDTITRNDMVSLHDSIARTTNMIVAMAGDFSPADMQARLSALFPADTGVFTPPDPAAFAPSPEHTCLIVHKPVSQAFVRMGIPMLRRPHEDYYDLSLLNMILGGNAFSSRLMSEIRSDRGLTYSIYSHAGSNYVYPSTFFIGFHCKPDNTQQVIELTRQEIRKLQQNLVDADELSRAKDVLVKQLPSMFRSAKDVVNNYARSQYYGRDDGHFMRYPQRLDSVSVYDIQRVARKYCPVDSLTCVIVGDTAQLLHNEFIQDLQPRITDTDSLVSLP
jgi:zinc protease